MTIISRIPAVGTSHEVDLFAIFQAVWKQKKLIALSAFIVGMGALIYAFTATPEYQVSSVLRPAALNELDALNRSEVYQLPPSAALSKVGASLESYETRLGFFRANQALFQKFKEPGRTLEQSFEEFNANSVKLSLPDPKKTDSLSAYIKLNLSYPKGVDGVAILNGLVDYAIAVEREQIAADLKVIVTNRLTELRDKIEVARSSYETEKEATIASLLEADGLKRAQLQDELKGLRLQMKTQRGDRISELSEAISIATSLGILKPTTPSALGDSDRPASTSVMRTEVNNQQIPLYFLGTEALEAERKALQLRKTDDFTNKRIAQIANELLILQNNRQIEILKQRKNDDLFLSGVQPLRAEVARLRSLNIDMDRLKLVTIDRQALAPLGAVKPKKAIIIVLGLMLGGVLGVILALIRQYVIARRTQLLSSASPALVPVFDDRSFRDSGKNLQND